MHIWITVDSLWLLQMEFLGNVAILHASAYNKIEQLSINTEVITWMRHYLIFQNNFKRLSLWRKKSILTSGSFNTSLSPLKYVLRQRWDHTSLAKMNATERAFSWVTSTNLRYPICPKELYGKGLLLPQWIALRFHHTGKLVSPVKPFLLKHIFC